MKALKSFSKIIIALILALSFVTLTACDTLDDFFGKGNGDGSVYSVTLETNGGTFNSTVTEYTSGSQCALPADGTKEHYTFDGWYDNSNFTGSSVTKIPASATGDKTYYAKWTPDSYNITFNVTGEASTQDTYTYGVVKTLTTPTKDGYTFNGWYANSNLSGSVTQINAGEYGDKTFYGEWVSQGTPVQTYTVTLHENGGTFVNGGLTSYTAGVGATLPAISRSGYTFNGWYDNENFNGNPVTQIAANATGNKEYWASWTKISSGSLAVMACAGYEEGAYVEFNTVSGVSSYSVAYKATGASAYTTIDDELVRVDTANGVVRADAVGLKAGDYTLKVTAGSQTAERPVTVTAYDRSGYAHFNYTSGVGGYNDDGTPKSGALIIYVSEETKNTVTAKINNTNCVGLIAILQALPQSKVPVIIRVLDTIKAATWNKLTYATKPVTPDYIIQNTVSKLGYTLEKRKYTMQELIDKGFNTLNTDPNNGGCSVLNGLYGASVTPSSITSGYMNYDSSKTEFDSCWNNCIIGSSTSKCAQNVTLEGIGTDAGLFQWGITWKYAKSVEVRNLLFDDYNEDACSFEGNTNSDTYNGFDSYRIWLHHCTFEEGMNYWDVCNEQDKGDGDGSTDFKKCAYITIAYNQYIETHKTGLIGGGGTHKTANVTFHHNYYTGCKARLPLARQANLHIYNNYYENITDTCLSLRAGAYALVEYCYFKNSNKPIEAVSESSLYGAAKVYKCEFVDTTLTTGDAYITIVSDRTVAVNNQNTYNQSFDTDSSDFYYDSVNKCSNVTNLITDLSQIPLLIPQLSGVHKN